MLLEKHTEVGRMTREHPIVKLSMVSPLWGTTPSSTGNDRLAENDLEIGLGRSMKNLAGSSGRACRFTAHSHTTLWPPESSSMNSHPCCLRTASK
jgi:hypothetical protein